MKHIKNLQIGLIIVAFLITIGGLFGGQTLTAKLKVEEPLRRDLHHIRAIRSYSVKQEKDGVIVALKLKELDNLQQVLDSVQQKVVSYYNQPVKAFKIADQRNRSLEEIRYQLSFYLEEAAVSGHYIQLKEALDSYKGIKARAYFDRENIYLQLEEGRNYLYEVIPVTTQNLATNNISGGESY